MDFARLPTDVVALIVHYEPAPARLLCRALRAIADERAGAVLGVARQHIGAVLPALDAAIVRQQTAFDTFRQFRLQAMAHGGGWFWGPALEELIAATREIKTSANTLYRTTESFRPWYFNEALHAIIHVYHLFLHLVIKETFFRDPNQPLWITALVQCEASVFACSTEQPLEAVVRFGERRFGELFHLFKHRSASVRHTWNGQSLALQEKRRHFFVQMRLHAQIRGRPWGDKLPDK